MTHYNVDQAVKDLLSEHAKLMLPDSAPAYAKIQYRNIAIPAAFLRLALNEANLGSPTGDVLIAAAQMVAQFIRNFGSSYSKSEQKAIQDAFLGVLIDSLKESRRVKQAIIIADINSEEGGHA